MKPSQDADPSNSTIHLAGDGTELVPRVDIDWSRAVPWWRLISQTLSISWRASHLFLAALGIFISALGWELGLNLFGPTRPDPLPFHDFPRYAPGEGMFRFFAHVLPLSEELRQPWTLRGMAYVLFGLLWSVFVWTFVGGLLARRTLMELGVRTSVGWMPSGKIVVRRWLSMVWAIMMPLVAVAGLACGPMMLGFVARLGQTGEILAMILMIPCLIFVIAGGWSSMISLLGFPLSVCAIVGERKADAFDGLSRSAAYLFQRPMTMLMILVVTSGLAWLGDQLIGLVLEMGNSIVWNAFNVGYGRDANSFTTQDGLAGNIYRFWTAVLSLLQVGFLFSLFWSASAAAYLTLRREIDHTDFDDLDLQEIGEPLTLPSVKTNEQGVTEVVRES
jgi:hypothetical protein